MGKPYADRVKSPKVPGAKKASSKNTGETSLRNSGFKVKSPKAPSALRNDDTDTATTTTTSSESTKKSKAKKAPAATPDWLSQLVSKQVQSGGTIATTTKEERKTKRALQLSASADRKGFTVASLDANSHKKRKANELSNQLQYIAASKTNSKSEASSKFLNKYISDENGGGLHYLKNLNKTLSKYAKEFAPDQSILTGKAGREHKAKLAADAEAAAADAEDSIAFKKIKKLSEDSKYLQPRQKDYNGQGMARPSIFMDFTSGDFEPRFLQQFFEHVDGFFGKVRTKSMKKQKKREEEEGRIVGMNSKEFVGMTPDEKVEAMIKRGLL